MQEAFRKAVDKSDDKSVSGDSFKGAVLSGEYRDLGNRFFNTVIVPYFGRGKQIVVPSFDHLTQNCLEIHPRLVGENINNRKNCLSSLGYGMRISEERLNPAYPDYFDRFRYSVDIEETIKRGNLTLASFAFLYGLTLLYGKKFEEANMVETVREWFSQRSYQDIVYLPELRAAIAIHLNQIKI